MQQKSRAEYFRQRREKLGSFSVLIDKERLNKLENILAKKEITKTQWLKNKIDEEK